MHAGQIRLLAMPFNHEGGLTFRGAGAWVGAVGKLMVLVSVTTMSLDTVTVAW
jgi:hypothetical protein